MAALTDHHRLVDRVLERRHSPGGAVTVDELVLQRRGDVKQDQRDQQPGGKLVYITRKLSQPLGDAGHLGDRNPAEQSDRWTGRLARNCQQPADRHGDQQQVEQPMVPCAGDPLPPGKLGRVRWRRIHQPVRQPGNDDDQDQRADCPVPGEQVRALGTLRKFREAEAEPGLEQDQRHGDPVKGDSDVRISAQGMLFVSLDCAVGHGSSPGCMPEKRPAPSKGFN